MLPFLLCFCRSKILLLAFLTPHITASSSHFWVLVFLVISMRPQHGTWKVVVSNILFQNSSMFVFGRAYNLVPSLEVTHDHPVPTSWCCLATLEYQQGKPSSNIAKSLPVPQLENTWSNHGCNRLGSSTICQEDLPLMCIQVLCCYAGWNNLMSKY